MKPYQNSSPNRSNSDGYKPKAVPNALKVIRGYETNIESGDSVMDQQKLEIISQPKTLTLYGYSKVHDENRSRGEEMMELLGQVWAEVGERKLTNTGINHAVYDCGDIVFSGLELQSSDDTQTSLVKKEVTFTKYAYWKHIGPYSEFGNVYNEIHAAIKDLGYTETCPSMEIYGHWTDDESKLETEIFISVE